MSATPALRWIATCARGLEEIVAAELRAFGAQPTATTTGGVAFTGSTVDGLRANWRLRAANRVLLELGSWLAPDAEALYTGARELAARPERREILAPERTLAVAATASRSALTDTRWIALKVKDAVVDAQRAFAGRRSDVRRHDPDIALRVRLHGDRATLLLDTSGEPLDRRGYRVATSTAPVREQLAAAALLAAGWNGVGPVVDPMCGSGTLLAEAGAIALGLAPNRLRARWAFEHLPGFDAALFARVRVEPFPAPDPEVRLLGVDIDRAAVAACARNLAAAGLASHAEVRAGDAFELEPPETPGLLVVNPPHGARLGAEAEDWRRLGDLLKRRYRGWKAVLLAGGVDLGRPLGLRPSRRIPYWNGPLEGRILVLDLW
ncbi:MAG TPA: RNA methyltransferase [Thermoanaerobaculia bacterium]